MIVEYEKPLNGAEIARKIGISRQAVSYTIRKSMSKMYDHIIDEGIAESPFQAVTALMVVLGVSTSDNSDIQQFLKMFDKRIIDAVTAEALEKYNIRN